jgi:hypothetical protein
MSHLTNLILKLKLPVPHLGHLDYVTKIVDIKKTIAPSYLINGSFVSNAFVYGKRFTQKHQLACFEGARNVVTSYKTRLVCTVPTLWALGFY